MKKLFLLVLVCLFCIPSVLSVRADLSFDIMPLEGPSTQSIFVSVRDKPIDGNYKQYMSVFFDGVLVVDRMLCVDLKNSNYMYLWDKSITVPKSVNGYGRHLITIWVETEYGLRKKLHAYYSITDGLPGTVESWLMMLEDHPEILAEIRGPKGDTGEAGGAGARGAKGETGARGPVAEIDYAVLWASVPPEVLALMKGEPGVRGPQGEPPSMILFALTFIVSVIGSAVFTWFYAQKKEVA